MASRSSGKSTSGAEPVSLPVRILLVALFFFFLPPILPAADTTDVSTAPPGSPAPAKGSVKIAGPPPGKGPAVSSDSLGPPGPGALKPAGPPPIPVDSLLAPFRRCADDPGLWSRSREETDRYAPLTWNDAIAVLPLARADRFGPTGYFETLRFGGSGSPLIFYDWLPWPADAGGLTNVNSWPRAGVRSIELSTPRLLPDLAVAAPGGAVRLESEPWPGGPPLSYASVAQGASGYQAYRFGFARNVTGRLSVQLNGGFRKADQFEFDSYSAFSSDLRAEYRPRPGVLLRAGSRSYRDEQVLFDASLVNRFSHDGADERNVLYMEAIAGGIIGHVFRSQIKSDAYARDAGFSSRFVTDERTGFLLSRSAPAGPFGLTASLRIERRKAEADGLDREEWTGAAGAGLEWELSPRALVGFSSIGQVSGGEKPRPNGEGYFFWKGRLPAHVRIGRAWVAPTTGRWTAGGKNRGVVRYGEAGIRFPVFSVEPGLRYFRREGDSVFDLHPIDAFFEEGSRIDERTDGVELSIRGGRSFLEWEGAWARVIAREKGTDVPLPYHSDNLIRGRVSVTHPVPGLPVEPRWDLLGEWRSDRFAPGREIPMDGYRYLRARVTVRLRGTDLFAQMERIAGHRNEYLDGTVPGTDGVLSGSRQLYFGLYWPFID